MLSTLCVVFGYACDHFSLCCLVFFFFKQKTAYEMRISDWSSDVCSSDLGSGVGSTAGNAPDACARRGVDDHTAALAHHLRQLVLHADESAAQVDVENAEIGRASCRERVCQYV